MISFVFVTSKVFFPSIFALHNLKLSSFFDRKVVMLYNFLQGSRILVLVLNEVVYEHLKISILIHTLTHNMMHQKATRPLLRTSLMNRLILITLIQESLALS